MEVNRDAAPSGPEAASRPIALVGYRGSGKSALGRALADRWGWDFLDLDAALEEAHGASIPELFRVHGEERFREWEAELLAQVLPVPRRILAPGGGVVEREGNRRLLRSQAQVVYLCVAAEVLVRRLRAGPARPPLTGRPLEEEVALVLARREPWYRQVAGTVLEVPEEEPPEATLARLVQRLAEGPDESKVQG